MINNITAIFFSILEIFSLLYFTTSLLKIPISKITFYRLLIISIIFSVFSIEMKIYNILPNIMPFIQILIIIYLVNKFTKIRIRTTIIIISASWFAFVGCQTLLMFLLDYYKIIEFNEVQKLSIDGYIIQLLSFIIFMGISFVTRIIREGYIVDFDNTKVKFKYSYRIIALITALFYIILLILSYFIFSTHNINYIYLFCILICIFTFVMLLFLFERDKEEVKKSFFYFHVDMKGGKTNEDS